MDKSIVEYFSGHEGYRCGYCDSSDTCYSHGMWAHCMAPIDYQNLIDRGWRRSGKYCYKPTMHLTCCPLYTIRCEAKKFTLTRSQKKVLKKVHKFLATGERPKSRLRTSTNDSELEMDISEPSHDVDMQSLKRIKKSNIIKQSDVVEDNNESITSEGSTVDMQNETCDTPSSDPHAPVNSSHSSIPSKEQSLSLKTTDLNGRPQCRKAKEIRREKRLQKLLKRGMTPETLAASVTKKNEPKSLEDFLTEPFPPEPAHKLELRFIPADPESERFMTTFEESYKVYAKYQMAIHGDTSEECEKENFEHFLVDTPFEFSAGNSSTSRNTYGSFHQQYWLDDKLIAVGVVDILPYCVSSVYFYYDPEYSFLSLGTYAALREIALTRELNTNFPDLQYYYMGYYIHSCVKMRYKGQYVPSFLLCPETYIFKPIEKCKPKLDISKYHRLEEDPNIEDMEGSVNLKEVVILYDRSKMLYTLYKTLRKDKDDEEEVKEYAKFVGRKCYRRMLLFRESEE